jgi:hypothetical protein
MPAATLLTALAAFQLGGCASNNNVVAEVVAPRPIPARLIEAPDVPKCELPPNQPDYSPEEVKAHAKCWRAAYYQIFERYKGLAKAVMARQRIVDAAKSAKS